MKLTSILLFLPFFVSAQDKGADSVVPIREYHFIFQDSSGHRIRLQVSPDTLISIEGDTMQLIKEMMIEWVKTDKLLQRRIEYLNKNHGLKHLKKYLQRTIGQFDEVRSYTSNYATYKWVAMDTNKGSISKIDNWREAGLGTLKQNHNYMLITIGLIIAGIIFGYFVGANNPLPSVKAKIKQEVNKL